MATAEPTIPTAAEKWKKRTLDALGVTFRRDPDSMVDFEFAGNTPGQPAYSMPMPPALQTCLFSLRVVADHPSG